MSNIQSIKPDGLKLIGAALNGDLIQMKHAVEAGVDINTQSTSTQRTALMICLKGSYHECIEYLLENKADPTLADKDGVTPLHVAVRADLIKYIEPIIRLGADINAVEACANPVNIDGVNSVSVNGLGATPLIEAITISSNGAVQILIDLGADINFVVPNWLGALDEAILCGNLKGAHMIRTAIAEQNLMGIIEQSKAKSTNEPNTQAPRRRGPGIF